MIKFKYLIGLSGVNHLENDRAKFWDSIFQWPMLMLAIWIPVQWYLDFRSTTHDVDSGLIDWLVWWLFLIELVLLSWLVDDKKSYFFIKPRTAYATTSALDLKPFLELLIYLSISLARSS